MSIEYFFDETQTQNPEGDNNNKMISSQDSFSNLNSPGNPEVANNANNVTIIAAATAVALSGITERGLFDYSSDERAVTHGSRMETEDEEYEDFYEEIPLTNEANFYGENTYDNRSLGGKL
jgi:hypothetical protein